MTTDFYMKRIFPLGFLMVRRHGRARSACARVCGYGVLMRGGGLAAQAATLGFGNLAYLHLSVSFIQMLKAAAPVMTMIILVLTRLEKLSLPVRTHHPRICVGLRCAHHSLTPAVS